MDPIQAEARALDLCPAEPAWENREAEAGALWFKVHELEEPLIPHGLHVVGARMSAEQRADHLGAMRDTQGEGADLSVPEAHPGVDADIPAMLRALSNRLIRPVSGWDLARSPCILPTGRNIHGFDPFRMPSAFAVREGAKQAQMLLDRHREARPGPCRAPSRWRCGAATTSNPRARRSPRRWRRSGRGPGSTATRGRAGPS